jgi:hypothetical protein
MPDERNPELIFDWNGSARSVIVDPHSGRIATCRRP